MCDRILEHNRFEIWLKSLKIGIFGAKSVLNLLGEYIVWLIWREMRNLKQVIVF